MSDALVLRNDNDHVATITLNRPEKYNALSDALMDSLIDVLGEIAADTSVRVVVLAANGKAFCAGHDLKEISAKDGRDDVQSTFAKCAQVMLAINNLPQPVIARVQGIATAAGCQLVATCDLAVVSSTARFATSGINVGLFCATPAVALSRNVPRKIAMEMLLSGDFIDAQTALQYGLVNDVVESGNLDSAIDAMTARIVRHSPPAISMGKKLFYDQLENSLDGAYEKAVDTIVTNMLDTQAGDGIKAFVAKKPMPEWDERIL